MPFRYGIASITTSSPLISLKAADGLAVLLMSVTTTWKLSPG
ncbi:MAG: hypothetical protein ACRDGH_07985 [Candidatus Limnocylindria bacterium]